MPGAGPSAVRGTGHHISPARTPLANCAFTFEELISYASRGSAVAPGDVLASGTCQRGCLTEIWGRTGERIPALAEAFVLSYS